jgi:polyisoprenoid-binding protein YceI
LAVALAIASILAATSLGTGLGPRSAIAAPVSYEIDPVHSEVGFRIRHLVTKVPGRFNSFQGTITYDAEKPAASNVQVTIDAASLDTKNEKRDGHLKSADFFDVEKFPTLSFTSKSVTVEKKAFTVAGDLTLHGVTKPVTLTGEMTDAMADPGGGQRVGFSAATKLNRKDFGILWNRNLDQGGTLLGDDVEITLEIAAVHKEPKPEAAESKAAKPAGAAGSVETKAGVGGDKAK